MRFHPRIRFSIGLMAMLCAALLTGPGVTVSLATEADNAEIECLLANAASTTTPSPGAADGGVRSQEVSVQAPVAKAREPVAAMASQGKHDGDRASIVVLNTRGFNYAERGIPQHPAAQPASN